MILVADSDSSKTYWILQLPESEYLEFETKGINPFYFPEKEIVKMLNSSDDILKEALNVKEVHFFGAGCSNPDRRETVSNALSAVFKNAFINVENKVFGCVYATCGTRKGITGILSTGSQAAYFDGEKVHSGKQGLGYILGDEGSATHFGKELITSYLYGSMPASLYRSFKTKYRVDKEMVMSQVYQKASPHVYLASFVEFMVQNKDNDFIKELLLQGFRAFVKESIIRFPNYKEVPCHFVGPVAFNFEDTLRRVCKEYGITVGTVLDHPIKEIYDFVISQVKHDSW